MPAPTNPVEVAATLEAGAETAYKRAEGHRTSAADLRAEAAKRDAWAAEATAEAEAYRLSAASLRASFLPVAVDIVTANWPEPAANFAIRFPVAVKR